MAPNGTSWSVVAGEWEKNALVRSLREIGRRGGAPAAPTASNGDARGCRRRRGAEVSCGRWTSHAVDNLNQEFISA